VTGVTVYGLKTPKKKPRKKLVEGKGEIRKGKGERRKEAPFSSLGARVFSKVLTNNINLVCCPLVNGGFAN
jgi:hypothetical protein